MSVISIRKCDSCTNKVDTNAPEWRNQWFVLLMESGDTIDVCPECAQKPMNEVLAGKGPYFKVKQS